MAHALRNVRLIPIVQRPRVEILRLTSVVNKFQLRPHQDFQYRSRHRVRFLPRKEMAGSGNDSAGHQGWKLRALVRIFCSRSGNAVIGSVERDRRDVDFRALRETSFHVLKPWLTGCVAHAVAIGMNHDVDKVRVIE
jgi:hypothetical protein